MGLGLEQQLRRLVRQRAPLALHLLVDPPQDLAHLARLAGRPAWGEGEGEGEGDGEGEGEGEGAHKRARLVGVEVEIGRSEVRVVVVRQAAEMAAVTAEGIMVVVVRAEARVAVTVEAARAVVGRAADFSSSFSSLSSCLSSASSYFWKLRSWRISSCSSRFAWRARGGRVRCREGRSPESCEAGARWSG